MNEEWIELKPYMSKVRKESLNRIFRMWLEEFGLLTPKQGEHIRRAMSQAIFEQTVLEKVQSSASSPSEEGKES